MRKLFGPKKDESGFSLTELLVVTAIMTAMALALLPRISRWLGKNELLGVARRVSNDFQFCRQQAISSNNDCTVSLTSSVPIRYTLAYYKDGAATSKATTISESTTFQSITENLTSFYFDYRGMASTNITITITNGNNEVKTVAVALAGKITMS